MSRIVCFGEILWDVFPVYKKIGGAPFNVANRMISFGNDVTMISAIGNDDSGKEMVEYLKSNKVNTEFVQTSHDYDTGEVKIMLNENGSASYDIVYPSAWDKISLTEGAIRFTRLADALIFGSLVARDEASRMTLYKLIESSRYNVLDLNLRPPYYQLDVLLHLMKKSDFIKFNDEELFEVCNMLGSRYNTLEQNLKFIAKKTKTNQICVTRGAYGAVLFINNNLYYNSGYAVNVVDEVGTGDSFLGALISQLLKKVNHQKALDFACAVGALVAQSEGANSIISVDQAKALMNPKAK